MNELKKYAPVVLVGTLSIALTGLSINMVYHSIKDSTIPNIARYLGAIGGTLTTMAGLTCLKMTSDLKGKIDAKYDMTDEMLEPEVPIR